MRESLSNSDNSFQFNETAIGIINLYIEDRCTKWIDELIKVHENHSKDGSISKKAIIRDLYKAFNYPLENFRNYLEEKYFKNPNLSEDQNRALNLIFSFSRYCNGSFNDNTQIIRQLCDVSIPQFADNSPLKKTLGSLFKKRLNEYLISNHRETYLECQAQEGPDLTMQLEVRSDSTSLEMSYQPSKSPSAQSSEKLASGPASLNK